MDDNNKKLAQEALEETTPLPEAPLSINVGSYYKGFYVGWTKRSAENHVADKIGDIKKFIDGLVMAGYEPSWNKQTSKEALESKTAVVAPPVAVPATPAPVSSQVCPAHNTPLVHKSGVSKSTGKPYSFWACPEKLSDGSFCKGAI